MTKEIELTQGKIALVDDDDFERLSKWKWNANWTGWNWYALRREGKKTLLMHREIMGTISLAIDHINSNGLDNQRNNLRYATGTQNSQNQRIRSDNTTGYKGVHFRKNRSRWETRITVNGKRLYGGYFQNPEEAALTYDNLAREYFGEFAKTNF